MSGWVAWRAHTNGANPCPNREEELPPHTVKHLPVGRFHVFLGTPRRSPRAFGTNY